MIHGSWTFRSDPKDKRVISFDNEIIRYAIVYEPEPDPMYSKIKYLSEEYKPGKLNECVKKAESLFKSGRYNDTVMVIAKAFFSPAVFASHKTLHDHAENEWHYIAHEYVGWDVEEDPEWLKRYKEN